MTAGLKAEWWGTVEYGDALGRQVVARAEAVRTGEGVVMGLEHRPVLTLGKRGGEVDMERAAASGYAVWRTRRGGLATCHEPGQLVGYIVVDAREIGVRLLVERLEGVIVDFLRAEGVVASRRAGLPGVWVAENGSYSKIAAVGLQVRQGWTTHGFAINLTNDLRGFGYISPCGIVGAGVTSLLRLAGQRAVPDPAAAWLSVRPVLTAAGLFAKRQNASGT
ncbi:MAG: lipoyl(octanoyl) transferase [Myxococcales bacterium]|nr:lipoyl(octanoyl) transferase [Myxococcales bacterium]